MTINTFTFSASKNTNVSCSCLLNSLLLRTSLSTLMQYSEDNLIKTDVMVKGLCDVRIGTYAILVTQIILWDRDSIKYTFHNIPIRMPELGAEGLLVNHLLPGIQVWY